MDLICVGEILIDFIPGSENFSYIRKAGGAPANVAIAAARNECEVGFFGKVGDDDFGRFLMDTLRENQVTPFVGELCKDAVTTMAIVTLQEDGERSFTFVRKPGADMLLQVSDIDEEKIASARMVHGGSFSLSKGSAREATAHVLKRAHEMGKLVSFDVNYRDFVWESEAEAVAEIRKILPYVDLLKISEEEAPMFGGQDKIEDLMKEYNISVVVETLGADGAQCFFNGASEKIAGRKANAVDATGAGDAFWGGFLSSVLNQGMNTTDSFTMEKLVTAMGYGNVAGWLCVQKKGAIDSLPTRAQIEEVLA